MRINISAAIAVFATMLANPGATAATWQPIGNGPGGGEKIEIDRSRVGRLGDGLVTLWSRASLAQPVSASEGNYNSVEALNRYDCAGNRFATIKRLYLLDNTLVRAEPVLAPREMGIAAGSVDAVIAAEVCKSGAPVPLSAGSVSSGPVGLMYADVQRLAEPATQRFLNVADTAPAVGAAKPAEAPAASSPALRRFIALPRIDPSQVQHPTDAPAPADLGKAAKSAETAAKSEAAKAGLSLDPALKGLDRHAREVALATSGPRRRPAVRRVTPRQEPAAEAEHKDIHWSYEGEGGAANWSKLRPDYALCEGGSRQSPIDIRDGIRVDLEPIKFDYRNSMFRIVDNGHTVQVSPGEGNSMSVMGRTYRLVQLHFHRPSEERIDGRSFEMVMHLVHKDDDGRLAVVAVMLERGSEHAVIQTFWNNLPLETNTELSPATAVDLNKLLPEKRTYYTYMGSLTTPPCSEGVMWLVLKQPLQLSDEQIAIFARLYKNNARPLQPTNGRLIKESR